MSMSVFFGEIIFIYLFIYLFIHYSNSENNTRNSIMNVNLDETFSLAISLRNKTAVRLLCGINCKLGHLLAALILIMHASNDNYFVRN